MFWKCLLFKLTLMSALIINHVELYERKIHHGLIGGHIKLLQKENLDKTSELLIASASGSKDKKSKQSKSENDEEKKTLSQQVADGKYGLIQKELFNKPSKRPGLISYETNAEVPKDNINNLGGLTKNDIWLAENHLLVLKGGLYPIHDQQEHPTTLWPAIDNYKAPLRQVKIPTNPKIPPPFPVQLTDDGPLQILGTNFTTTLNGTTFDASSYPIQSPDNYEQEPYYPPSTSSNNNYTSNVITGQAPFPISPYPPGEYKPGLPFPPFPLNGTLPPFFASLPPGAAILPPPLPPGNLTNDQFDEDDPSIYYPPPYSFYYPKDNSSIVPAGPLVPGIILPPPPNFFGPLEPEITTRKNIRNRIQTTTPLPQIRPTTTPIIPTSFIENKPIVPSEINNELKPVTSPPLTTTPKTRFITITPIKHKNRTNTPLLRTIKPSAKPLSITILKPITPSLGTTNTPSKIYVYNDINERKPFKVYGPPPSLQQQHSPINTNSISTTQVPLKIYYSSTSNEIDIPPPLPTSSPSQQQKQQIEQEKQIPEIIVGRRQKYTTKSPKLNEYYYYEEDNQPSSPQSPIPTRTRNYQQQKQQQQVQIQQENNRNNYYNNQQDDNYYISPPIKPSPIRQEQQQPQYYFVTTRPYNSPRNKYQFISPNPTKTDSFSIHIARLQKQIQQYYTTTTTRPIFHNRPTPKPVYQFSFQAANYQPQRQNDYLLPLSQQQPETNNYQINYDNQDRFRPIPKYSVQIEPAIEIIPTQKPPQSPQQEIYYQTNNNNYQNQAIRYNNEDKRQYVATTTIRPPQSPTIKQYSLTENPIYQTYYTKSADDERYLDENTRKYFSTFGQKLNNFISTTTTTPLSPIKQNRSRIRTPSMKYNNNNKEEKPVINLEGDTIINYLNPRPNINTQSEFIEKINYNHHQPSNNKNVLPTAEGQPGSFISYQLPGDDGAHFYFLTPQLAQRRDQGIGYYYSQQSPQNPRIERNGGDR